MELHIYTVKNFLRSVKRLLLVLRVHNTRIMILFYFLGVLLSGSLRYSKDYLIIPIIFVLSYGYVSLQNYEFDQKIDKVNKRGNTLVYVEKYVSNIKLLLIILAISISLLSSRVLETMLLTVTIISFGYFYSSSRVRLSYNPYTKFLTMFFIYTLLPGFYGLTTSKVDYKIYLFLLGVSIMYSSFMIYSDVKDIKGDSKFGKKTFAIMIGTKKLPFLGLFIYSISIATILLSQFELSIVFWLVLILIFSMHLAAIFKSDMLYKQKYRQSMGYLLILFLIFVISYSYRRLL